MASILGLDPAGLAEAAGVLGQMSGPSRLPVGLGSILGAAGGAYSKGKRKAAMDEETLQMQRELRKAQTEQLNEQVRQRQEAVAAQQDKAKKLAKFQSILQTSGNAADPISILGAGVQSGAFGPQEITSFMGNVMQKQAKMEADIEKERLRLQDRTIAREEREAAERRMAELQNTLRQDNIRLAASLRAPPAPEPLVPVDSGDGRAVYAPRSQAVGKQVPPRTTGDRLTESEAKGTLFFRQMRSAEEEVGKIVGPAFDPNKLGSQVGMRMANSDWTNWAAPANAQRYAQSTEQWAEAYLRLKTGAATNRDEIKRNARAYFPQPGDSAAVIRQKNEMRKKAIADVSIIAGRGVSREPEMQDEKDPWEQ